MLTLRFAIAGVLLIVLVVGVLATVSYLGYRDHLADVERARGLSRQAGISEAPVRTEDFSRLPVPVARYLRQAIPPGARRAAFARLRHRGEFRADPAKGWMPLSGEYHLTASPPSFVWFARVSLLPVPGASIVVRDSYVGTRGRMSAKLFSAVTVADASGPEVSESSLGRYLSELVMMPTSLLPSERLSWEPGDERTATVRLRDGDFDVAARFAFDAAGLPAEVTLRRYRSVGDRFEKADFVGRFGDYRRLGGFLLPSRMEGGWTSSAGYDPFVRFELLEAEFR